MRVGFQGTNVARVLSPADAGNAMELSNPMPGGSKFANPICPGKSPNSCVYETDPHEDAVHHPKKVTSPKTSVGHRLASTEGLARVVPRRSIGLALLILLPFLYSSKFPIEISVLLLERLQFTLGLFERRLALAFV